MVQAIDYKKFLELHKAQLLLSGVPEYFWHSLYIKLKNEVFDSNETFELLQIDYENEFPFPEDPRWLVRIKCEEVKCNDQKHIYLIDHAWTFRINNAREQLLQTSCLIDRMCNIMQIEEVSNLERVDKIFEQMWKYCHTYSINVGSIEDRLPVWYIMDELGCGIQHSDDPNFRTVPFVYIPQQITYTLLFPIKDINVGETATRDFVEAVTDPLERKSHLIPWFKCDFTKEDFTQYEPDEEYFLSGHIKETLPLNTDFQINLPEKIKVFSEYSLINTFLTHERFECTEDENIADILWYTKHFKSYAEFSKYPNRFVNQFPFENVLTIKDLLSIICRRKSNEQNLDDLDNLETSPIWLPTTYNLKTELKKFISYYQHRERLNLDNHWICKPWNLARSLDTYITTNLDFIVKLAATGPKIVQKYIHQPVLFYRSECGKVKFDVRYVILLKSVSPLKAYAYRNFFLRFANKPFELNDFHDYEKHFTVMNYSSTIKLHHLPCVDFLKQWEQQYPNFLWHNIEQNIFKMLREMLEAATNVGPPKGIAHNPQSRAVYAVDIMLSWNSNNSDIVPKLLEVNWTPDCQRACDYYPNFYNDIFAYLFLNDDSSNLCIPL